MLVARREIRERLRGRVLVVSTVLLMLLVGGSAVFASSLTSARTYRVAVVAPTLPRLAAALQRAAAPFDAKVQLTPVASAAAGRQRLEGKHVDALLLLREDRLVFRTNADAKLGAIANTAVSALRHDLPPPELATATLAPPRPQPSSAEVAVATIGAIAILLALEIYGQWVLVGVVEEKSNRVAELILSTVRSRHLLAGKVTGIGLLAFAQMALVAGLGAILLAAGVYDAPVGLGGSLALVIPWFALGFALYAVAFAAAGALASGQQDASTAGQPVMFVLLAAFLGSYVALHVNLSGTLANVLTVFPLTSPFVLPARAALVGVPLWEHALALVLIITSIYAIVRVAGRIYSHGLLHAGPRLDPRAAWRLAR